MDVEVKCKVCGCTDMCILNDVTRCANVYACSECGTMKILTATDIVKPPNKEVANEQANGCPVCKDWDNSKGRICSNCHRELPPVG